jgi:hypothetical protein
MLPILDFAGPDGDLMTWRLGDPPDAGLLLPHHFLHRVKPQLK